MKLTLCVIFFASLLLSGCSDSARVAELERRMSTVESLALTNREYAAILGQILHTTVTNLDQVERSANWNARRTTALERVQPGSTAYHIALDAQNYDIYKSAMGPVLVVTDGADTYLDGYKVRLRLANLTTADFDGLSVEASWGRDWKTNDTFEAWVDSQHAKTNSLTTKLRSGWWTPIEVNLAPCTTEELRQAEFHFRFSTVSLRSP